MTVLPFFHLHLKFVVSIKKVVDSEKKHLQDEFRISHLVTFSRVTYVFESVK